MSVKAASRRGRTRRASIIAVILALAFGAMAVPALANHYQASLEGSNFEIDDNANLIRNVTTMADWATVTESRKEDKATGTNDDSYQGGVKEDTPCPATTTGSIPNNKSDLLNFGVYVEAGTTPGDPGYLHMFWNRVSDPSGTTLMDFEFNKSGVSCAAGKNKVRTTGDMLIEYSLDGGGAQATMTIRRWMADGSWGSARSFANNEATGTVNTSAISPANSDGLLATGAPPMEARTFGEASIDLDAIFDSTKCESFGSAMLKSRSSTSFTSQLKDFIEPVPVNLTNCGKVIIRKVTDPAGNSQSFGFTKSFATDPSTGNTFNLSGVTTGTPPANVKTYENVLFGTSLTVSEDANPTNWALDSISCAASSSGVPAGDRIVSLSGRSVTFTIDSSADILDCTFTNKRLTGSILVKKVSGSAGGPVLGGAAFGYRPSASTNGFTSIPGVGSETGWFCQDGIAFGSYLVRETTTPAGYQTADDVTVNVTTASTCAARTGTGVTRTPDATFVNNPANGTINIVKQDDAGNRINGITFTLYRDAAPVGGTKDAGDTVAETSCTTSGSGTCSMSGVPLGNYWLDEAVPANSDYEKDSTFPRAVTVGLGSTANTGQTQSFTATNPRKHKIIVLVCHEGTNTLAPSAVTRNGGNNRTSLGAGSLTAQQQADLCALTGATYSGLGHGNQNLTVDVGSAAHP